MWYLIMAVINGMSQAGIIDSRYTIGDEACRNDDILYHIPKGRRIFSLIKVVQGFRALFHKTIGAVSRYSESHT